MRIAIDLDGVICQLREPDQNYSSLEPVPGAADRIRQFRAAGDYIIITTARHMKTCGGNPGLVVARQGRVTLEWLNRHNIEFDEIHFGKPHAHVYIDDNAVRFVSWEKLEPGSLPVSAERQLADRLDAKPSSDSVVTQDNTATTVVIPMAGRGSRFFGSQFVDMRGNPPKPLIDVAGRPMIWWALQSLRGVPVARLVFVVLEEHDKDFVIRERLHGVANSVFGARIPIEVAVQKGHRDGQLCSVLEAREFIAADGGVLVMSADTFIVSDIGARIHCCKRGCCGGLISVANLQGSRWSFARADESGRVIEVAEKRRISDHASTGMYYFANGSDFIAAADLTIQAGEKTNGEYYVIPVFRRLIDQNLRVEICPVHATREMGTPEALEAFLEELRMTFVERYGLGEIKPESVRKSSRS